MRETQILRGLHKARANCFADGFVSSPESQEQLSRGTQSLRRIGAGSQTAKDIPFAAGDVLVGAVRQPLSAMFNGARSAFGGTPQQPAPAPDPAAVAPTLIAPAIDALQSRHKQLNDLSRGTAFLEGPGTGTSDSIPAHLSRGEAVLPAKTVQKVGAHNIARLIQQTNDGKAPHMGLRAGAGYEGGTVDIGNYDKPKYVPPKVDPLTGAYTGSAPPPAPSTPPAPPETLSGKAASMPGRAYNWAKDGIKSAGEAASSKLGGVARTLGVLGEGVAAARDITTPGMEPDDKWGRVGEGAGRLATGAAGAKFGAELGAGLGTLVAPGVGTAVGGGLGALGGGIAGYMAPEYVMKQYREASGSDAQLPSEKAAGLRAQQPGGQPAATQPAATQPAATQPAATQTRAAPTTFANPMDAGPHPDLSAQLASAPKDLSTVKGLQQGAIYKTTGASGNPMYSGMNVTGNAPFVDGLGKSVTPRGSVGNGIVGEGSNVVDGNAGLRAAQGAGGGPDVSALLQAAAKRGDTEALRNYYQRDGGTWLGKTAEQDAQAAASNDAAQARQMIVSNVQRGLAAGGRLTRSGMAALQGVANNEAQREASQQSLRSAQYRHDTPSGDAVLHELGRSQSAKATAEANATAQARDELAKGNEALSKRLALDPAAQGATPEEAKQRHAELVDHLSRTNRTVIFGQGKDKREVDLATAFRLDPRAAEQAVSEESGTLSLSKLARAHGSNFLFKNVPKAGEIELAEPMGDVNLTDFKNGMGVPAMLWEKAFGSGVVRLKGANNKIVSVPLSAITDDPNSAAIFHALAAANERFKPSK